MQMSRERFQEVHKLIWNIVIAHAKDVKEGKTSVRFLKQVGISTAYAKGLLDLDELELLDLHHINHCLLCATFGYCEYCPLGDCYTAKSLYYRAARGDEKAMREIRDIVDKEPFTGMSIMNLYDWMEE